MFSENRLVITYLLVHRNMKMVDMGGVEKTDDIMIMKYCFMCNIYVLPLFFQIIDFAPWIRDCSIGLLIILTIHRETCTFPIVFAEEKTVPVRKFAQMDVQAQIQNHRSLFLTRCTHIIYICIVKMYSSKSLTTSLSLLIISVSQHYGCSDNV